MDSRIIIDRCAHKKNTNNFVRNLTSLADWRKEPVLIPKDSDIGGGCDQPEVVPDSQNEDALSYQLTPEDLMLCVPTVYRYGLKFKRWLAFDVESIGPVKFNDTAFQSLVLPADQKELILAFAESQVENKESFDDVIEDKGKLKGLVLERL